jgi:hypothetical protein
MDSFDQSLKYLLQKQRADFVRFALGDATVEVRGPVPSGLPSRSRDIDGADFIERGGDRLVAHFEFHRRHQGARELAVDVGEAQIRLYRREGLEVVSLVWDLYGARDEPVIEERSFTHGATIVEKSSEVVYLRVNLRGLGWKALLAKAPPALWPLVALTQDGACEDAVHEAKEAIEARTDLTRAEQADHLAVLWFVAEAETLPVRVMKEYIRREKLMESELYREIFGEGEAKGRAEGEALGRVVGKAEDILAVLDVRGVPVSATVRARILGCKDPATLDAWIRRAAVASTAAAVVRTKAAAPPAGAARYAQKT